MVHQDVTGEYYNSGSISGSPDVTNTSANINYSWGGGAITPGNLEVAGKFTGKLTAFQSRTYSVSLFQDDGATFKIDGVSQISKFGTIMYGTDTFSYNFNAFQTYALEIDWKDIVGGAGLILSWDSGSGTILIPSENYGKAFDVGSSPLQVSVSCPNKYEQIPSTTNQCRPICGDGFVVDTEVCDDGNTAGGDGCNSD